ncbi:hypothetical protein STENM327S_09507 [Streptomyces tendae]
MGRVYLGRTPAGSAVAVKVIHRAYAADPEFRKRFALEVAAARRVQGLYTVPVVAADLEAEEPWLATAYAPGPSLQHAVGERGPLPADEVLTLTARVAEALETVHAAGVIHRDLKPANIVLTADEPQGHRLRHRPRRGRHRRDRHGHARRDARLHGTRVHPGPARHRGR